MLTSFRNVALAGLYIFGISQFLFYGGKIFSDATYQSFVPFVLLLLFTLSAAVVGSLVFGQAVLLFFENKKTESILSVVYSLISLFIVTVTGIVIAIIVK